MKKISVLLLTLLLIISLFSCAAPDNSNEVEDPYQKLLFPSELQFGMTAETIENQFDITISGDEFSFDSLWGDESKKNEVFSGFTEISLGHYCAICAVTYSFENPREKEFEDERTLKSLTFEIRDTIPYSLRTEEKHGDIQAEYEEVRAFISDNYGDPIYTYQRLNGLEACYWDIPESEMGIVLSPENAATTSSDRGSFTLCYKSTVGLYDDWYLR